MAKRKKASKSTKSTRTKTSFYKPATYGIKYNSLTFLLFLVFVLVFSMILVGKMWGMSFY